MWLSQSPCPATFGTYSRASRLGPASQLDQCPMPRLESKPKPVAAWVWHIKTELICASARPAECISFFKILPEISVPGCAKLLYVSEESRRCGWGTKVIRAAEAEAVSRGCHGTWGIAIAFRRVASTSGKAMPFLAVWIIIRQDRNGSFCRRRCQPLALNIRVLPVLAHESNATAQ